eukprot:324463-Chlamydomonas_euryale.AAC.12
MAEICCLCASRQYLIVALLVCSPQYGRITTIDLKLPPRPPAFAFVIFEDERDAEEVIAVACMHAHAHLRAYAHALVKYIHMHKCMHARVYSFQTILRMGQGERNKCRAQGQWKEKHAAHDCAVR